MNDFSNMKKKLLVEQTEDQLFQYILHKPIAVGEKLPNEFKLGEQFGVGRSTIREAVKSLVSKGILEIRRGSGTYVISLSSEEDDPLGLRHAEDKFAMALDIANVRMMLEPDIAQMAALNATEQDILKMSRLCDQIEEKIKNNEPYIQEDILFHTAVAEGSKNKVVEQLIPIIDTAVMMFMNVTHKQLLQETIITHRQVVDAIAERDSIGAKTAMMMHMTYNRNFIKKIIKEQK